MNQIRDKISYKMIDISNHKELNKNILFQIHQILQKEANWGDSFLDFKKSYTKRNFKNLKLFLIFHNKELAGFIEGWRFNTDQFYCKSFYVSSKYKNLNIGKKLRLRVFSHLKSLGFKKFISSFIVNDLVNKIDTYITYKRKKEGVKKKLSQKYSFSKKRDIFLRQKKIRRGKK